MTPAEGMGDIREAGLAERFSTFIWMAAVVCDEIAPIADFFYDMYSGER